MYNTICSTVVPRSLKEGVHHEYVANTSTTPSFRIVTHHPQDVISGQIHANGCFECELLQLVQEQLLLHPTAYLLDVGGNLGLFSLLAASMGRQAYTFEPYPDNWRHLCRSIQLNPGFDAKIKLYTVALGDGMEDLFFAGNVQMNSGAMGVVPVHQAWKLIRRNATANDMEHAFQSKRLDQFQFPLDIPVVLKVDVEGSECSVLEGGLSWLQKANIVWAVVEMSQYNINRRCGEYFSHILDVFRTKGMEAYFHNVTSNSLVGPINTSTWKKDAKELRWMQQYNPISNMIDIVWK